MGVRDHLSFRLFTEADTGRLTDLLHRAYAPLAERGLNYTAVDQDAETTLQRATSGATWLLFDVDELVGSVTMSLPPELLLQELTAEARAPGRVWFNQFAVAPEHQNRGYGSLLRGRAFAWARSQGATSVGLDTGLCADDLISLYSHWGFRPVDVVQRPGKTYKSVIMVRDFPLESNTADRDQALAKLVGELELTLPVDAYTPHSVQQR